MRQVRFKSYMGVSQHGKPSFYDCSDFNEKHLVEMINQPQELEAVSFQVGHQIYGDHLYQLFIGEGGGREAARWNNQGFAKCLAQLGYRVIPAAHEIEIR